jgi:hypothetical protein
MQFKEEVLFIFIFLFFSFIVLFWNNWGDSPSII